MKRIIVAFFLSVAASSAAAQVIIDNTSKIATGTFYAPATPGRLNAYIYCELYGAGLYCGASDDAGNTAWCSTTDPAMKKLFPMIRKTSVVQFFWNDDGTCGLVEISDNTINRNQYPIMPGAFKSFAPVYVSPSGRYAYGTVAATATTGAGETIGCLANSGGQITCTARTAGGAVAQCTVARDSASQTLADQTLAVTGINESSMVYFSWDVASEKLTKTCNFIYTFNASYQLP